MIQTLLLWLVAAPAQIVTPSSPPPPIVATNGSMQRGITSYRAGQAQCGVHLELPVHVETPLPSPARYMPSLTRNGELRLSFRIAADGRPLSIRRLGLADYDRSDVTSAFAAWRFTPGEARDDCTISFETSTIAADAAEPATLHYYLAILRPGQPGWDSGLAEAAFERTLPPGSTCAVDQRPSIRQINYPAFEEIRQEPGRLSYSFVGFDIDATGVPENVRILSSSGKTELDLHSTDAIGRSRFAPVLTKGCTFSYYRAQPTPLAAPEAPPVKSFRTPDATCPEEPGSWENMPALNFPAQPNRRSIEGWAIVRYDLAPWGQTGNLEAVASEPVDSFGEEAKRIIRAARKPASKSGYSGCLIKVVFKLPENRTPKAGVEDKRASPTAGAPLAQAGVGVGIRWTNTRRSPDP